MKQYGMKLGSAVLAILLFGGAALAQGPGGPHGDFMEGHMLGFFTDLLDLTDAQQAQIKQIFESGKATTKPLRDQERQSHEAMKQLITGTFDLAKAQAIANQEAQVHAQLEVQHAQLASQAYQVLTADQKTKLAQFMAKREQRMQEHMQQGASEPPPAQ